MKHACNFKDLTGLKFGRLLVLSYHGYIGKWMARAWVCQCDCGTIKVVTGNNMKSGKTVSCGCKTREDTIRRNTTHGLTRFHPIEYRCWCHLRQRCNNQKSKDYPDYGGRGIKVCQRWMKFENFLEDMGRRPEGMTLDRIDVNGNYCPENCRWATGKQQIEGRRISVKFSLNGKTLSVTDWSAITGISYKTLISRRYYGWTDERILTAPKYA